MINQQARRSAKQLAAGHELPPDAHPKIRVYGHYARILADTDWQRLQKIRQAGSLIQFRNILTTLMQDLVTESYHKMPANERFAICEAAQQTHRRRFPDVLSSVDSPLGQLRDGSFTAADMLTMELRTIARQTQPQGISHGSLVKSQRVPFSYAMTPIEDIKNIQADSAVWSSQAGGDNGEIFRDNLVNLSPTMGLQLTRPPVTTPQEFRKFDEPAIGCPITLVPGAFKAVHDIAVSISERNGLIVVNHTPEVSIDQLK